MVNMSSGSDRPVTADDERLLTPEQSLALVEVQREEANRSLRVDPVPILGAWGVAWLAGFGAIYLALPAGPGPFLPTWAAGAILGVLFVASMVVSVGQGVWRGRGIEGPSRQVGAMYGWSWLLGLAGLYAVNFGLTHKGVPSGLLPLLWSGSALLVVGVLYLAGGMLWRDRVQYGLGAWTLVVGAASVSAGVPANFAVLSLAGGGGFLIAAGVAHVRGKRSQGRPTSP